MRMMNLLTTLKVQGLLLALVCVLGAPHLAGAQSFSDPVRTVEWSADGLWLAAGYESGLIEIQDAASEQISMTFDVESFDSIAWGPLPDAHRLAASNRYGQIWIWDVNTGSTLLTMETLAYTNGLAWSPDGRNLAIGLQLEIGLTAEVTISLWDAVTGDHLDTLESIPGYGTVIDWSPDGNRVTMTWITINNDGPIAIWAVTDETELEFLYLPRSCAQDDIDCLGPYFVGGYWSPDGTKLLTAGRPGIQVWDAQTYQVIMSFPEYITVSGMTWSPDGSMFAVAVDDSVIVWDTDTGDIVDIYTDTQSTSVNSVAWSPDGTRLAYGDDSGELHIVVAPDTLT
jgi:WD40 repeat protein